MRRLVTFLLLLLPVSTLAASPGLVILSPVKGQILPGQQLTTQFLTPNFAIPKQGHIHLWLDQTKFTKTSAIKAYTASYDLTNLKYGYHTLTAELVKPDHSSFTPAISTSVTFKLNPESMFSSSFPKPDSNFLFLLITLVVLLAAAFFLVSKQRESYRKKPAKSKSKKH